MVKADTRRDYYADLGLAPSAELEDIKRQFRKLALKYHPDRNPGKEVEFIARFQAIQAAHEILSDPQQRLKYDTERLRAGYGKYYTPRANTSRKTPTSGYAPASAPKPAPFSARPQHFQNGPSNGAQRYASYARAAHQQQWGKKHDDGQTRADAYRAFQGMKNSPNTSGRGGFANSGQSPRPKSAYEYFKTPPKQGESTGPTRSHTSARKKNGFAPGTSGGDEPMAANTSAYSNVPREDRAQAFNYFFDNSAPSPTARKTAASNASRPDLERSRSQYASTGGEKTFFSSSWLGRTPDMRYPQGARASRTNPPSPTHEDTSRHRSASPNLKTNRARTFAPSSTSSDVDDDDDEDEDEDEDDSRPSGFSAPKPKAVPKSRIRRHQRSSDKNGWSTGTGEHSFPAHSTAGPGPTYYYPWTDRFVYWTPGSYEHMYYSANREHHKGHDSDSAAAPRNPFAGTFASRNFQRQFDPTQQSAKSSSHGNLRQEFSPQAWDNVSQEGWSGFFAPKPNESDNARASPGSGNRGRQSNRNGTSWTGQPTDPSSQDSSRSRSTTQQQPTPFAGAAFSADDWVEQFKNLSWVTNNEGSRNQQRSTSPKKQTRPAAPTKVRPTPQPASVSTEPGEETKPTSNNTPNATNGTQSAEPANDSAEAMDLDDETPAKQAAAAAAAAAPPSTNSKAADVAENAAQSRPKAKPAPRSGGKKDTDTNEHFDLKNLTNTVPFTSTNNSGIDNLQDITSTLPFESRPKAAKTNPRDVRPRELACPNPPKRPRRPGLMPTGIGAQMGLPRQAWERYVGEMNAYMREWNEFNRRMLRHFNARQEANETGLAPGWISSVGDSARVKVNGDDDDDDDDDDGKNATDHDGDDEDNIMVAGSSRGGYSTYLRAIEEDVQVRKHWDVASELHRECILELGELREWILNGGKLI